MNHDELAFLAEVSSVNQVIAVYIGRVLDIDGGRTEYSTTLQDLAQVLAARLFAVAQALEANACVTAVRAIEAAPEHLE